SRAARALSRAGWPMALLALAACTGGDAPAPGDTGASPRFALAVVGDSDSHSYQDRISFPEGDPARGGAYRAVSFNWYEILARLRADQLDLGEWGVRGTRGRIARALRAVGIPARAPRKQDYDYNFAISGAGCEDLVEGYREVPSLLAMMDADPAPWRHGAVVFRIGVNSFGTQRALEALGADPGDARVNGAIDACVAALGESVARIHARHPDTRVVLVGIFDNTHWAMHFDHAWSPEALANVARGLDRFDDALRAMAASDDRVAFFDDRAWFRAHFGDRDARGQGAYRTLEFVDGTRVENKMGDAPTHTTLADGHAGTLVSGRWAASLLDFIGQQWGLDFRPLGDRELLALVAPTGPAVVSADGREQEGADRPATPPAAR
ncbi:SGNH/GDSL hydrolase family protein, partial [Marilutibacter aestuarii]|uniref:SGNH/GDSL hydrolase family protein n=1 Tax=Marilutibacter aestuarii TaxID=1706195 RepID=UPI00147748AD